MKATTGMAACWARTAPGHAAAALPRSVMNSRRRMYPPPENRLCAIPEA
jgi:hypothetical protein